MIRRKESPIMSSSPKEVTRLLKDLKAGKEAAGEALFALVYDELHALAGNYMRFERRDHTLQATALVHEAYLRLGGEKGASCESRAHFMVVAARAMRRVLIDHARRKLSEKRGKDRTSRSLEEIASALEDSPADLLALDSALEKLSEADPTAVRMVELRFFGGLTVEETAEILKISTRSVVRKWRVTRTWLKHEIGEADGADPPNP
jgi:RNA polymerase sigma factor (TIGR02999 family)